MQIIEQDGVFLLQKEGQVIGRCPMTPTEAGATLGRLTIDPRWQRRGYGTYLLKELLRRTGGFDPAAAHLHTAPLPQTEAEAAFWAKQGFAAEGGQLARRRTPDLTAVRFAQDFLAAHLRQPGFCVDATCGNGNDTLFLCRLCAQAGTADWRVLAMDLQPQAIQNTTARLAAEGFAPPHTQAQRGDHAALLAALPDGCADAVLFNFGWLPGADHSLYSTADTSLPALRHALRALKKGGILSAVLYSGKTIGTDEKQSVLGFLRSLPLAEYTVLECRFANWADTAPLPCLVLKK